MAIQSASENYGKRTCSGKNGDLTTYGRSFLVRSDDPEESLEAIRAATGIAWYDSHPDDTNVEANAFSIEPADESGLLWTVSVTYETPEPEEPEDPDNEQTGDPWVKLPIWSAGSSVVAVPIFEHYVGNSNVQKAVITNSAGDPLENLEAEAAEFRLSLTQYFFSHTSWLSAAVSYTNAVNSDVWHGKPPGSWKCQGVGAQVSNTAGQVYWELTWEFAYRETWRCMPWDLGFHERVGEDGQPSYTGTKRRAIVGQDKKPVKQPVALNNGVAMGPGSAPMVINNGQGVRVYRELPFTPAFGQIYTPVIPNS